MGKSKASGPEGAERIRGERERWELETLKPCLERGGERLQAFTTHRAVIEGSKAHRIAPYSAAEALIEKLQCEI
jgi:hypothetical protein